MSDDHPHYGHTPKAPHESFNPNLLTGDDWWSLHESLLERIEKIEATIEAKAEARFQDLCHNATTEDVQRFCDGCEKYQIEKFGRSPIADLRSRIAALEAQLAKTPRCDECGNELTDCGPMSIDGPTADCPLCQCRDRLKQAEADRKVLAAECDRAQELWEMIKEGVGCQLVLKIPTPGDESTMQPIRDLAKVELALMAARDATDASGARERTR